MARLNAIPSRFPFQAGSQLPELRHRPVSPLVYLSPLNSSNKAKPVNITADSRLIPLAKRSP